MSMVRLLDAVPGDGVGDDAILAAHGRRVPGYELAAPSGYSDFRLFVSHTSRRRVRRLQGRFQNLSTNRAVSHSG